MMPHLSFQAGRRAAMLAASALALSGCGGVMPQLFGPRAPDIEQIRVPQPAPETSQTSVAASSNTASEAPAPDRRMGVTATYRERILVPTGSTLTLRADPANGGAPAITTLRTQSGPPYALTLPVSTGPAAYPMTVEVTLTSSIGHVLRGGVVLDTFPAEPVDIVMRTGAVAPVAEETPDAE